MENNERTDRKPEAAVSYEEHAWYIRMRNIIYYILGVIEVLLLLRLLFKLLGANPASPFVGFIYTLSGIFGAPFFGIFRTFTTRGVETASVFEPSTVIALLIYPVIARGLVKLVQLRIAAHPVR